MWSCCCSCDALELIMLLHTFKLQEAAVCCILARCHLRLPSCGCREVCRLSMCLTQLIITRSD